MAKNDKAKDEKGKKDKKTKDRAGKGRTGEAPAYSSIATHPRAFASVRRVRSWTGILAFAVAAALSFKAGVPFAQTCLRALAAGFAGYLLTWWGSMKIWRHLMIAEQRAAAAEINRRRAERDGSEIGDTKAAARG
jgi:hypothetical protein